MTSVKRLGILGIACCVVGCPLRVSSPLLDAGRNVPVLPDGSPAPEPCSARAKEVMRALRLRVGVAAHAEIDANQFEREPLTVFSGPVESMITEPMGSLSAATRFYGWIWTTKRGVVIRYYHVQNPDREVLPICAVARKGSGQLGAKPGAWPGSAELEFSSVAIFIVEDFI